MEEQVKLDGQNWIVTAQGNCEPLDGEEFTPKGKPPYRFYRFLADMDDVLETYSDPVEQMKRLCPMVRRVMEDSFWLQLEYKQPNPKKGWSVSKLYKEPGYKITVQMVAWSPQQRSTIHNHAAWGLVCLLDGEEKNTLWRRKGDADYPDALEKVGDRILTPGDIICFVPEAIHCVEAISNHPTVSFNLYGITNYKKRYKFDLESKTAKLF